MRVKFLIVGAIVGGLVLFFWGFIWNAALPLSQMLIHEFKDPEAVNAVMKDNGNGFFYTKEGVFATVGFLPDMSDKTQQMGTPLIIEFIRDVVLAYFLALLLLNLRQGVSGVLVASLAASVGCFLTHWNWYGFPTDFTLFLSVGLIVGWVLTAIVLNVLRMRMAPPV